MGIVKEFKEFALKGNVLDLAVGVIIGGAFGGIVTSLIKDLVMPVVGLAGKVNFADASILLRAKDKEIPGSEDIFLNYGSFITVLINFLIMALVLFLVIKLFNEARRRFDAQPPATPPAPTREEILLTEIRDLLARKQG